MDKREADEIHDLVTNQALKLGLTYTCLCGEPRGVWTHRPLFEKRLVMTAEGIHAEKKVDAGYSPRFADLRICACGRRARVRRCRRKDCNVEFFVSDLPTCPCGEEPSEQRTEKN